jgi:hypothetical protein
MAPPGARKEVPTMRVRSLLLYPVVVALATVVVPSLSRAAEAKVGAAWDSVSAILQTKDAFAGGYHRFNLPRRDLTLRVGDVTVAPELALGAWAGFSDDPEMAMLMGDLVLQSTELGPVLAELAAQKLEVTAIHNHLVGEEPRLIYVHFGGHGRAIDLARRLDRALARTATPRPVAAASPAPLAIDSALVFGGLGRSGRTHGSVAQVSFMLVPGKVTMDGMTVTPALGYASPVNIQAVDATRAVATGDFAVTGSQVPPMLRAFAAHGITATALHTHMIGESPTLYFIHFWADAPLAKVVEGLRAVVDAAR